MAKTTKILIGIAVLILVAAASAVIFINRPTGGLLENNFPATDIMSEQNSDNQISLIIDNGDGNLITFNIKFNQGDTVFDILKRGTEDFGIDLKTQNYDIGILVQAIGNLENGKDEKYWLYYVNGEMPMVSADKNDVESGDKIEFKFEKSPY